jgi:hypothetical protein
MEFLIFPRQNEDSYEIGIAAFLVMVLMCSLTDFAMGRN